MSSSDRGQRQGGSGSDRDRDRPRISRLFRRTSRIISGSREPQTASESSGRDPVASPAPAASAAGAASGSVATAAAQTTQGRQPPAAVAAPAAAATTLPAVQPKEGRPTPGTTRRPDDAATKRAVARDPSPEVVRSTALNAAHHHRLQEQKARMLFAKYNMVLEDGDWHLTRPATEREWTEKKTRLRVHRQCHRCQTGFGSDRVCKQCDHTRCKKCPRVPSKGVQDQTKLPYAVLIDSDPKYQKMVKDRSLVLTMEGKHGQELVRKHPVHRVRRTCHRCDTLFIGKATQCENCQHTRCPKCPREPAKEKKFPDGYPGDTAETFALAERHFRHVRQRVRWQCHNCQTFFLEHQRECGSCQHQRCDDCNRIPPKKVKKDPDPAVLRSLEEKLNRLQVSTAA